MVRKSTMKYYSRFLLLYAGIFITIFILLFTRGNFNILLGDGNAMGDVSLLQIIYFYLYKYVLNFPFGFINWIEDKYLFTTGLFMVPDSIFMAWLIAKFYPQEKKNISKIIYYILLGLAVINFMALLLALIQGDLFQKLD